MTAASRVPYRLSAAELDRMVDAGLLADARVELIDGQLLALDAQGAPHAMLTVWRRRRLEAAPAHPTGADVVLVVEVASAPSPRTARRPRCTLGAGWPSIG